MGLGFFLVLAFLIFLVVYTIVQFLKFLDSLVKGTGDTIMPVKRGSVLMPLVFALVILSSMPFLLHAQVYEKEKGQQSEPPKLLTSRGASWESRTRGPADRSREDKGGGGDSPQTQYV